MIFPLWKFWTYSPHGFIAACLWNVSELFGFKLPYTEMFFGWIIGKGKKKQ